MSDLRSYMENRPDAVEDDWIEDDRDEVLCDHDDYDVDILSGRASCNRCMEHWYVSDDEVNRQIEHEAAYHEHMERENRRQWWSDVLYAVRHPLVTIHWQLCKRGWIGRRATASDDDIPF